MQTSTSRKIAGTVLAVLLGALPCAAHDHTALNGTWTLVPAKSNFAGQPVVQTGTVTINEREGNITVSRNFTYTGATQTFFYRDMTDSENGATIKAGKDLKSKARWDHDVLKVTTTQDGIVTEESYSLTPDGAMLARVVKPGQPEFTLNFERK